MWLMVAAALQVQELPTLPFLAPCDREIVAVCRKPATIDTEEASGRLGPSDVVFWADGEDFHVLARRPAQPQLCCAIQSAMEPVNGSSDLWTLTAAVRDLDEATLDVLLLPADTEARPQVWRGPSALPPPPFEPVREGEIVRHVIQSTALGEDRGLFIYRPPGDGPMPVIYLGDGEMTDAFAGLLRPMIEAGEIPPVMIVGLWSGPLLQDGQGQPPNRRHYEYLTGWNDVIYRAHERFLIDEVMPLAESLGASGQASDRVLMGFSDGASWALNTATVRPDLVRGVIALSFAGEPDRLAKPSGYGRIYLAAGTLEGLFHDATVKVAARMEDRSEAVRLDIGVAGHSQAFWQARFTDAVPWVLLGH